MLEYLNFFLICTLFALIFYLYALVKRYVPLLKMAEDIFSSYDKCILTCKLYLGKVYTEEQLVKLNEEEVENSLIIMKLSYWARW